MRFQQSYNINPSNTQKHTYAIAEIYVNSPGDVYAIGMDGTPVLFKGLTQGDTLKGYFAGVMEEQTTEGIELIARIEWPNAPLTENVTIAGT